MFSTIPKTNFNLLVPLILFSASSLNLGKSKILSFGKELKKYDRKSDCILRTILNKIKQHRTCNVIFDLHSALYNFYLLTKAILNYAFRPPFQVVRKSEFCLSSALMAYLFPSRQNQYRLIQIQSICRRQNESVSKKKN